MNIEARKIEFIQEFLKLQNEEVISHLEIVLKNEQKSVSENVAEPMTQYELNSRIEKSMKDSDNGKLTEVSDLLNEIEKWN
jgi:hypothetical protein